MKKLNQISNILFLVSAAFCIKAYLDKNIQLVFVAVLLFLLALFRRLVIKQAENIEDETYTGEDSIIRYFKTDPALYAEMRTVYQRGNCDILYEENDGLLLYDHTCKEYLASAKTMAGARDILLKLPMDYETLIIHDDIFLQLENKEFKYQEKLCFYNFIYEKRALYKIADNNLSFKPLDEQYLPQIKKHYRVKALCNDQYLKARIKDGMLGAFFKDELVGFIGRHDNGAIGMLEVFDDYRGKHIGTLLQMMYTNKLIKNKDTSIIYTQVQVDNEISMHLQEKLLLKRASHPTYWYFS